MRKILTRKTWPLILSFLAPIFIMACYFAYRNMSPFGDQSILTVDLGQQYVDLFAFFKHVLLGHPSGAFYSFSKAFGGEMFGTWAYYLMSPLNLLLLIIPNNSQPAGILLIILLKYGLSGLSFSYLLTRTIKPQGSLTVMWSVIYALNGWMIANQINVMWLDGMIWLPLVILGVNQIFKTRNSKLFIISITFSIISNYYMGYMISLFTVIYIIFKFSADDLSVFKIKSIIKKLILAIMISTGLCSWLILPTWNSLLSGKSHYPAPHLANQFEYPPLKMTGKLFNGTLNFDQLPSGTPNLFIGSVALIGFLIYLFQHQIQVRKRIAVLVVTIFLTVSMCYQPLDLLWHGDQFPVWYPYRFSYIFCFWIIWIAANAINGHYQTSWRSKLTIAILISLLIAYVFINRISFPFISPVHFALGILFLLIAFILLLYTHNGSKLFAISLLCFSTIEMTTNAVNSLNNLTYISNRNYTHAVQQLSSNVGHLSKISYPYRIGKTFYRSKNDPLNNNYLGGDVFDSSLEYTTPRFMRRIGEPEGRGFSTYSNGTLLSDRLLGFRYFMTVNHEHDFKAIFQRPDINNYALVKKGSKINDYLNPKALPLTFMTYPSALHIRANRNPIRYQERWYRAITHQKSVHFKRVKFTSMHLSNAAQDQDKIRTTNPLKTGDLSLNLKPKAHSIYYLLITPKINTKSVNATVNGRPFLPQTAYNHKLILNLTSGKTTQPVNLNLKLLQSKLNLRNIKLYRLNVNSVLKSNYQADSHIDHFNNCHITGHFVTSGQRKIFATSIPATKGWHLYVDNVSKPVKKTADEFIATPVKPGHHTFTLIYTPPMLFWGLLITSLTICCLIIRFIWIHRINKKPDYHSDNQA